MESENVSWSNSPAGNNDSGVNGANCSYVNGTSCPYVNGSNCSDSDEDYPPSSGRPLFMTVVLVLYGLICCAGTVGNGLVIIVVLRFAKMRSVTNTYIFNLALSDLFFLLGLPFLIVTVCQEMWIFGDAMCKVFYVLTSLNQFTGVFTLTVMSADRYLAVCHAIASMPYRTPFVARFVCLAVWAGSFLVMLPIFLYAKTVEYDGGVSCTIEWPKGQAIREDQAFIWYAFCLSFAAPVSLISVFYFLVVLYLKSTGPNKNTRGKKKSQRKVTILVLSVITVYVVCWLPYWIFQTTVLFLGDVPYAARLVFQIITILSYANSALNPVLYAFLSDNFRQTFIKAFRCASAQEVNRTLCETPSFSASRWRRPGSETWSRAMSLFGSSLRKSGRTMSTAGPHADPQPKMTVNVAVELQELVDKRDTTGCV